MRSSCVARVTCLRTCPSRARLSIPRPSSHAIPTSFSPQRRQARVRRGSPIGSGLRVSPRYAITAWWPSRTRHSAVSVRASSTPPRSCVARSRVSVAEVRELQRYFQLRPAQQRNRRLQVIALLAADAHLVALHACLHLELRVLHQARELASSVRIDAVAQHHLLLCRGERGVGLLDVETRKIDAALGEPQLHDLEHLPQLKVHLRVP